MVCFCCVLSAALGCRGIHSGKSISPLYISCGDGLHGEFPASQFHPSASQIAEMVRLCKVWVACISTSSLTWAVLAGVPDGAVQAAGVSLDGGHGRR